MAARRRTITNGSSFSATACSGWRWRSGCTRRSPPRSFGRRARLARAHAHARAPQHPKSALQEWAAAHNRKAPAYEVTDRSGPHHAPRFTVRVSLGTFAEAEARGASKQEAETAAAAALLAQVA